MCNCPVRAADYPQKLEDAGTDGAMAGLQADAAAAQKVGDGGDRFTFVPAVCADREDQVAERQMFLDLFHGWNRKLKVKPLLPESCVRWQSGALFRFQGDR